MRRSVPVILMSVVAIATEQQQQQLCSAIFGTWKNQENCSFANYSIYCLLLQKLATEKKSLSIKVEELKAENQRLVAEMKVLQKSYKYVNMDCMKSAFFPLEVFLINDLISYVVCDVQLVLL